MRPFSEIDLSSFELLRSELEEHPEAFRALRQMGITHPFEQVEKYVYCNFGAFTDRADITLDGILRHDHWECCEKEQWEGGKLIGTRGCPHEGKFCHLPEGINGVLTRKELEITKLIGEDLCDKEIASRLSISTHTVAIHRTHIEHKIGAHSKVGVVVFAKDQKII